MRYMNKWRSEDNPKQHTVKLVCAAAHPEKRCPKFGPCLLTQHPADPGSAAAENNGIRMFAAFPRQSGSMAKRPRWICSGLGDDSRAWATCVA